MLRAEDRIGPYTLIRKLGQGSFGVVWLAERRGKFLTTQVALKIPIDDEPDLDAIRQEAETWLQAIGHPNVLPVLDADEYDGQIVIVSEYAPDGSLVDWMKRNGGKGPSVESTVRMTCGILSGLEHLHSRKMIHRDLKPGNVLLQGDTPMLTDFGVSRVLRTVASTKVAGTPVYMAPEMFDGVYSEQTDVWAVGVMLYKMLSGSLPFSQQGWGALYAAIKEDAPPPLPVEVPEPVRRVVVRALAKALEDRYASARAMREDLNATTSSLSVPLNSDHAPQPTILPAKSAEHTSLSQFDLQLQGGKAFDLPAPGSPAAPPIPRPILSPSGTVPSTHTHTTKHLSESLRFPFWSFSKALPPCRQCPRDDAEMIWIAPGEFLMGDSDQVENPRKRIALDGFWIYRTPVTVGMYRRFCIETGRGMLEAPPWDWIDDHPIVNVQWQDAMDYCKWAGASLPSETQWEKAARGMDGRRFPWGGGWDPNRCRCSHSNYADAGGTISIGHYPNGVSPYGVLDMAGNVWEWCHEMVERGSVHGAEPGSAPRRVLRGGSWESNMPGDFRTSFRQRQFPSYMYFTIGFRCIVPGEAP